MAPYCLLHDLLRSKRIVRRGGPPRIALSYDGCRALSAVHPNNSLSLSLPEMLWPSACFLIAGLLQHTLVPAGTKYA
jgi:hypothetical protein